MTKAAINREEILNSTLFHIQILRCQYIDDFPEVVTSVFEKSIVRGRFKKYDDIKRRLYRINTNFFDVNKDRVKKREFFLSLYQRLQERFR